MKKLIDIHESVKSAKTQGLLYGKIRDDMKVSHGAFRLWHVLKGMSGKNGCCWPGQRYLAEKYPFSIHSLKSWIQQLVDGGYVRLEKPNQKRFPNVPHGFKGVVYLIPGTVAQTGHSTVSCLASALCPVQDTATVSCLGHIINSTKLIKKNQSNREIDRFSFQNIEEEFIKLGSTTDQAQSFFDYNQAHGWKIDGQPLLYWKKAARGWIEKLNHPGVTATSAQFCSLAKCVSDKDYYRVESNGVLYEFDRNTPPNGNHRLAWRNHFRGYVTNDSVWEEANRPSNPAAKHKASASQGPKKVIQKKL
jgi:hypothetical protein